MSAEEKRRLGEIEDARHYRLVQEAQAARELSGLLSRSILARLGTAYRRWMHMLGDRLVRWGCRLQTRYAQPIPSTLVEGEPTPCG
jgi:hypothetical protein